MGMNTTAALMFVGAKLQQQGKVRKGRPIPYLCHLAHVLAIVAAYGGKENAQMAAIFHDTIEDLDMTPEEVMELTNPDVLRIVQKLTDDKGLTWTQRKEAKVALAGKCCQGVGVVLIADKIDNLGSLVREMPVRLLSSSCEWDQYWARFNAGYDQQYWYFDAMLKALQGNKRLTDEPEYPELRTADAINELEKLVYDFRRNGVAKDAGLEDLTELPKARGGQT